MGDNVGIACDRRARASSRFSSISSSIQRRKESKFSPPKGKNSSASSDPWFIIIIHSLLNHGKRSRLQSLRQKHLQLRQRRVNALRRPVLQKSTPRLARLLHYRFRCLLDPHLPIRGIACKRSGVRAGLLLLSDPEHRWKLLSVDSEGAFEGHEKEAQNNTFSIVYMFNNPNNRNSDSDWSSGVGDTVRDSDDDNVLLVHNKFHSVRDENFEEVMRGML